MAHQPTRGGEWEICHGLYAQDGTYRPLPTAESTSLPILDRHDFPEISNPDFVWGYVSPTGRSYWHVGHDWSFSYRFGNVFSPTFQPYHIWYGAQLARLYGLTRWFFRGEVYTERSFGIRNEQDLICRLQGGVNPLYSENELDWDTFDLRTAETTHDHKNWKSACRWDGDKDEYDSGDEDGEKARAACFAWIFDRDGTTSPGLQRRHSFSC